MKYYKSNQYKIEFALSKDSAISYEQHNHVSIYAVGLILDGRIVLKREKDEYECTKDDLFIISPYKIHSIHSYDDTYTMVTLCLGTEFLNNYDLESGKFILISLAYDLVRIAPNKSIKNHIHEKQLETHEVVGGSGTCINDGTRIEYETGIISMMPAGIEHAVTAGDDGLYLFAKFFPASC